MAENKEGNFNQNVTFVSRDSIQRVKAVFSVGWFLAAGLYCYFWYRSTRKPQAGTASPFSPGQQAIQSGIVAGCRGVVLAFAVVTFSDWLHVLDRASEWWDILHSGSDFGDFVGSLVIGLVVAIIAALVTYATIESRTGRP
jgi:hypothetical protein